MSTRRILGGAALIATLGAGYVWWSQPVKASQPGGPGTTVGARPAAETSPKQGANPISAQAVRLWQRMTEDRLAAVEKQLTSQAAPEAAAGPTEATDENVDPQPKPVLTEAQLGAWMDSSIASADWDAEGTRDILQQVTASVTQLPATRVDAVGCSKRFCRATFYRDDGEKPGIRPLIGAPPFETGGFTLIEPDGRVAFYFARQGESIDQVRGEAETASRIAVQ